MNKIKQLRLQYKLSLRQLQKYTGIDFSRLAIIEKTDANLESKTVEKLTNFFKVSNTYLFGDDGFIFYYDEHMKRYFPMPYQQYKDELKDDVVSSSIVDGCVRRVISLEGYDRINKFDDCVRKDLDIRLTTERYLDFLEKLSKFDFERQRERINEYFEMKDIRRKIEEKDGK